MTRDATLNKLLGSLFSAAELRMHLAQEREGNDLLGSLPEEGVPPAILISSAVNSLKRRGFLDRDFFDNLAAARPNRKDEIRRARAQWIHNPKLDRGELWADGRYELDSPCGQGGFGLVWKAVDTRTGAFVALKILLEQHSDDRRVRQRFFRGAAVLAELSHPAIVRVRSAVEQEGLRFFYAMDFIDGERLDVLVGKRPVSELLQYVLQIGDALGHIHARDLLHRDIKPSNILVTVKRQAKLIDFDLVTGDAFAVMTTRALGTALYAPPEATASDKKNATYDVFSLARTVEYVIRGREPTVAELGAPDPVATLNTSHMIKAVLRAALRSDPAERTQSIEQFCSTLRAALKAPPERPVTSSRTAVGSIVGQGPPQLPKPKSKPTPSSPPAHTPPDSTPVPRPSTAVATPRSTKNIAPAVFPPDASSSHLDGRASRPNEGPRSRIARNLGYLVWPALGASIAIAVLMVRLYPAPGTPTEDSSAAPLPEQTKENDIQPPASSAVATVAPVITEKVEHPPAAPSVVKLSSCAQSELAAMVDVAPMCFAPLSAGSFQMGSPKTERDRSDDENQHAARVDAFAIGTYEVTRRQWKAVMGPLPDDCGTECDDSYPVTYINWNDACQFMVKLTKLENETRRKNGTPELTPCYTSSDTTCEWKNRACTGFRLPTEAEWEYAARANTNTAYSFSNDRKYLCSYGNVADVSARPEHPQEAIAECNDSYPRLAPVGQLMPNVWGLHDMHGNVWEWVWDWYASAYKPPPQALNYAGPASGATRVLRGGAFNVEPRFLRSASRTKDEPTARSHAYGFRCVFVPYPSPPAPTRDSSRYAAAKTELSNTDRETEGRMPVREEDISVECLLDPSKCKRGGSTTTRIRPPPDPDLGLPEKLELADIKAGTDPTKAAARSKCAGKAKGGEKVKIKLSIAGPSGTVLSSTPEDDAFNAALAQCAAAELKKSTFKKVQKEQIGTIVSISF